MMRRVEFRDTREGRVRTRRSLVCLSFNGVERARHPPGSVVSVALAALLLASTGCGGSSAPLDETLAIVDVQTGYHDGGVQAGQNRLLPTLSFRVKNDSTSRVSSVQFNAVFRVIGDEEELGAQLIRGIDSSGLQPGDTTGPYVLRSDYGYTGEQARIDMFQHDAFQDVQVELFAKQGGGQWVRLLDQVIDRQLVNIRQ